MQEFIEKQLVWTVAMPLGIAIVCMLIAWRPWQHQREAVRGWWGGALAIGLAYLVGHVAINRWPAIPPASTDDVLFLLAVAATAVGLLESMRMPAWLRWSIRAMLAAAVSWFMLSMGFRSSNSAGALAAWTVGQAAVILIVWTLLERLAERRTGPSIPLAFSLMIAVASIYFFKGGSGKVAQLSGLLAASLGGTALVAMFVPRVSAARGMLAIAVPLYMALILYSWQYPKPLGTPVILAAAPLALWLAEWRESVTAVAARVLLVAAPALVALTLLLAHLLDAARGESLY
ncbi:MAG: hypothetical protein IT430_16240 [Phycisphaerales bacterium]|nr:hypothetical protein [Phycisphaerales bacterium]